MSRTQMIGMKVGGGGRWVATRVMVLALVVGLVVFGHASVARAAPKGLDPSFGSSGRATTDFSSSVHIFGSDVAVQDDGKVVVAGGAYTGLTTDSGFALARYNPDGSLDTEFDVDGKTTADFFGSQDNADEVAVQDDGRIVAVGTSASDFALALYNPDGSPNASFSNDGRRIPTSEATTTRHGAS
jgi:uncharacterized delta-60 repeat protein